MRTWRTIGKICMKFSIFNIILIALMLATTVLTTIQPVVADTSGTNAGQIVNISPNDSQYADIQESTDIEAGDRTEGTPAPQVASNTTINGSVINDLLSEFTGGVANKGQNPQNSDISQTPSSASRTDTNSIDMESLFKQFDNGVTFEEHVPAAPDYSIDEDNGSNIPFPEITDLSELFNKYVPSINDARDVSNEDTAGQGSSEAAVELQRTSSRITPDQDSDIELSTSGRSLNLHVPAGAVDQEVQIDVIDHGVQSLEGNGMLSIFELNAFPTDDGLVVFDALTAESLSEVEHFNKNLTISIQHNPDDLWELNLDTLRLYYLDEDTRQWVPVPDSSFDSETCTLTATIDHFSYYGEHADPTFMGPGKVMNYQTDLHTGAATYSYPIEVPPGVSGFQPNLNLIYNSAGVDEMKNKKDVGSWVGTGWSLGTGSIQQISLLEYVLTLDGATYYRLVYNGLSGLVTVPETYYNISITDAHEHAGSPFPDIDSWEVKGTDGIRYTFGGTENSTQYITDESDTFNYRWDLSSIEDTHGNTINIDYVQDTYWRYGSTVRSAYTSKISYNNNGVKILFDVDFDREDIPYCSNTSVIENGRLNSIRMTVNNNLVREYSFTYNTTPMIPSEDYGGTNYAGTFTLTSITETGSDDASTLPSMNFSYADLPITCKDSSEIEYNGNPGNLATLTHPYLTGVTNGYGATVNFSYSEKPQYWHEVDSENRMDAEVLPIFSAAWCSPYGDLFVSTYNLSAQENNGQILHYDGCYWTQIDTDNTNTIWDIHGTSPTDFYAAGEYGTILKYNGSAWSSMNSNTSTSLRGIWEVSDSNVYAVGDSGTILHYNGSAWSTMTSNTSYFLSDVWASPSGDVYAVGDYGTILSYNGSAWSTMMSNSSIGSLYGVWGTDSSNVYTVGDNGAVLHYNGSEWDFEDIGASGAGLFRIWGSSSSDIYVGSLSEYVFHYNGSTWSATDTGTTNSWVLGICGNSLGDVYAAGIQSAEGFALKYNGSSWSALDTSSLPELASSWVSTSGDIFVGSTDGKLLRYNGYYWTNISTDNSHGLWDMWGSSSSDVFAVGMSGTILHYNGSAISATNSSSPYDLYGVWGSSSTDVFAVGLSGTIVHWDGYSWTARNSSTGQDLYGVWGTSSTDVFAVGNLGTILHYDGSSWSTTTNNSSYSLLGIWGSSSSDIFAVGSSGTILHYDGLTWSAMDSGTTEEVVFRGVWGYSATDVFAVGMFNAIYHYDGISWSRMDSGVENGWAWLLDVCGDSNGKVYVAGASYSGVLLEFPYTKDIWTRQIVTGMTVDSGNGPLQTADYVYTGEPQYFKVGPGTHPWDDRYRGFPEVRVIDAEGNYVDHYFWTTGSGDAEILTGREYRTEWYDSSDELLQRKDYTWAYRFNESQPHEITRGNVAYWTLDENEGQTVYNYSGSENWGTLGPTTGIELSDPQWANGRFNSSLIFDGVDDYVDINGSDILDLDPYINAFALEAWVKRDSINTRDCILAAGTGASNESADHQLLWYIDDSSGESRMVLKMGNGAAEYINSSDYEGGVSLINGSLSDSQWHWVAVLFASSDYPLLYHYSVLFLIDGMPVSASQGYANGCPIREDVTDWRIGSLSCGGDYFHGSIDDVRIYQESWGGLLDEHREYLFRDCVPFVYLEEETDTIGSKVSRTRYAYDAYGNVEAISLDGDITTVDDDSQVWKKYYANTSSGNYIVDRLAMEVVLNDQVGSWESIMTNISLIEKETWYIYDGYSEPEPDSVDKGDLTEVRAFTSGFGGTGNWISAASYTYDDWGNRITETDGNGNTWNTTYDYRHLFPINISSPAPFNQSETYTFNASTGNILSRTDVNGQTTSYDYDAFGRLTKVIRPGDNSSSPSIQYEYNDWGNTSQHLKTLTKVNTSDYLWSSQYFDGFGRVIQVQSNGEAGRTIIGSTAVYNSRGLQDRVYVPQDLDSAQVNGYVTPDPGWKYSYNTYDALGRVVAATAADGTITEMDYSEPWQTTVTNPNEYKHTYYYDAFNQLIRVDELDAYDELYATTTYDYDAVGNLVQVEDTDNNITSMTYDLLGRKTNMSDPDMGNWSYEYDNNGNLISQTDAKDQTVTLTYDEMNRITAKLYPAGLGMANVSYTYDDTTGDNYGVGRLTAVYDDVTGSTTYTYDERGRLTTEYRFSSFYTYYEYDAGDRLTSVTYPTEEKVTQTYTGRGLPDTLSGNVSGELVTGTTYNELGQVTKIDYGNDDYDTYAYYGLDGAAPSGYWGRLWQIQSGNSSDTLQDIRYTWDANGNLMERYDAVADETETFTYDFLDRLTSVSGAYSANYSYNEIGNIMSMNGVNYTYGGSQPHAVTQVGNVSYTYDANGNMVTRGDQTMTWDMANMPVLVTDGVDTSQFIYDGNGDRVLKVEGDEWIFYINQYYELNYFPGEVTSHYYLGGREVAYKVDDDLRFVHQDHLSSTSLTTSATGDIVASVKYFPFGECRNSTGTLDTDKLFTGQRLDDTGLYYYNARYYDATIGRFISADTVVPNYMNPQTLNRYSYCLNNPLKYIDPSGHDSNDVNGDGEVNILDVIADKINGGTGSNIVDALFPGGGGSAGVGTIPEPVTDVVGTTIVETLENIPEGSVAEGLRGWALPIDILLSSIEVYEGLNVDIANGNTAYPETFKEATGEVSGAVSGTAAVLLFRAVVSTNPYALIIVGVGSAIFGEDIGEVAVEAAYNWANSHPLAIIANKNNQALAEFYDIMESINKK